MALVLQMLQEGKSNPDQQVKGGKNMLKEYYDELSPMEEIEIDDELEEILRSSNAFHFPAVTIGNSGRLYLNIVTDGFLDCDRVKYFTTPEYIIILPATKEDRDAFFIRTETKRKGRSMALPVALVEKKIKPGIRKMYKYKNGICFKRYKLCDRDGVEYDA
jgi:hypothetical protein